MPQHDQRNWTRGAVDVAAGLQAIVHTAQPHERDGAVVGVTLDLLRKILAGQATHVDVTSTDCVMRIPLVKNPWKGGV